MHEDGDESFRLHLVNIQSPTKESYKYEGSPIASDL